MKSWLVHESLVEEPMFPKEETLVRSVHNESIVDLAGLLKVCKDFSNTFVNGSN
jgi:hypothetical protein